MTKNKWIQDAIKHRGALRKTATKQGLIKGDEKLSMSDLNKLEKEGGKTAKQASLAKTLRSFADGGVIASNIIMQLGGFSRLQIMLGAYNFVDLKNGVSFKIKNARSNYIKITLNEKDLYDIEIGRIRGTTYKVIYKQEDVYAADLKYIIENKTGMFMAFEDGGDVPMDMEILIISQVDKLANGGITALEVLEAREFVGEEDWKKMKPKERLSATRYLVKTGKIGYYEKPRKYADGVQLNKYKVKYLIGYSDDEDALKYHEGKFYADSKDNVALEVFEHFKRLGYSHIEILEITLVADKGMEVKLTDEELNEKYLKLKGDLPNWFKDMPTRYKEEIIEEVEEELQEEEFANGGGIGSKRDNVINYYINNEDDDILIKEFDVSEDYLKDRNLNYSKIFDIISDNLDDEDISYKFRELNLGEESEEPNYIEYGIGGLTMDDGGKTIAGFPKDYHELNMNFLKIFNEYGFLNSEKYGNNTYVNENGDIIHWWPKTNHSAGQLRLTFNKTYNNFNREVLYDFQKKHIDYSVYYEYFFKNWVFYVYLSQGKESNYNTKALIKLFDEFNLPKGQRVGKLSFTPYYANGGEIEWGEDLGDGFSVGNDVYITDSKSMYQGKTGFVIGLIGKDLLVTILENGNERNVFVSKKGVEKLDAPEFSDGGELDDEDSLDYNSISDLQAERNRLVRWKYQYNNKGADYKIKQLEERIDYLKSKYKMAKGGKVKEPNPDYPDFISMQYKKGGALKYYNKENEYKIGRPSGYIEKEILSRVDSKESDFIGSFGWKTENKKMADGYLYKLSDFDKKLVKDVKLKSGEKIFRYFNRTSAIGGMKPLIKINLDKELLYFLKDSNNIEFETRGVQAIWVALIEHKL